MEARYNTFGAITFRHNYHEEKVLTVCLTNSMVGLGRENGAKGDEGDGQTGSRELAEARTDWNG